MNTENKDYKIEDEFLENVSGGSEPCPKFRYTVKTRETLADIASHFGSTEEELKEINGLYDNNVTPGSTILIPYRGV